jgi:1-acyl-sn-glycerol-3-phosphate acyltransferase
MARPLEQPGSLGLALGAAYQTIGISLPTVIDSLTGRLTPERCDARLDGWADRLIGMTRAQLSVSGLEHIPARACVLMTNHQSYADIPLLYAALPAGLRVRAVAKHELFYVPIWGRAMRLSGFIPIVRSDRQKAIESLELAKQRLAAGTFIWIFPEGTRSRSGALGPLKKGGFILARDSAAPILPASIDGSARLMPPQGWRLHYDQPVHIRFRPLIQTAGRPIEDVMAEVAQALDPQRQAP